MATAGTLVLLGLASCGGGGGGGGDVADEDGGVGIGANGITVFWWRYGFPELGSGTSARATADGGFVLSGFQFTDPSFDPDTEDAVLIKTGADGRLQWQRRFDGGWMDEARCVQATSDGGYVLAGLRRAGPFAAPTLADAWLLKTDADGAPQWQTIHGGAGEGTASSIVEIPGGYAVAGEDEGDAALLLVDPGGQVVDERTYGGSRGDRAHALARTPLGGFVLAGVHGGTPTAPGSFLWAVETDASGDVLWEETYGQGSAYAVQARPVGGFVLAGEAPAPGGDLDLVVLALDEDGQELWRRTFGGGDDDWARGLALTASGGCVAAGTTRSFSPGIEPFLRDEVYLIELDALGSTLWQMVKGKSPESSDGVDSVVALADGGFLLAGRTNAHVMLTKVDENGATIDLGGNDLTLEIPDVPQGIIGFSNALHLGEAAVGALTTLRAVGPFGLGLLLEILGGRPIDDFCSSGALAIAPDPLPLQLDTPYAFSLTDCVLAPAPELLRVDGAFTLTVESTSGDLTGRPHDVQVRYELQTTEVTDDVGTTTLSGQLNFSRSVSAAGDRLELTTTLPGDWLWRTEDGLARRLTEFSMESSDTAALATLGPVQLTLEDPGVAGTLALLIEPGSLLTGVDREQPESGSLSLAAQDGSRLTLVATGAGRVRLDVDTNADGTVDLAVSTTWEVLD
jgi:hypothetical protein